MGLSVQLREFEFGGGGRVGDRDIELEVEFVLEEVVDVPAFTGPTSAFGIGGGDAKPIVVVGLVHLRVGYESLVLFLQPLRPCRAVSRTRLRRKQRDLCQSRLRVRVPTFHLSLLQTHAEMPSNDMLLLRPFILVSERLLGAVIFYSDYNIYFK